MVGKDTTKHGIQAGKENSCYTAAEVGEARLRLRWMLLRLSLAGLAFVMIIRRRLLVIRDFISLLSSPVFEARRWSITQLLGIIHRSGVIIPQLIDLKVYLWVKEAPGDLQPSCPVHSPQSAGSAPGPAHPTTCYADS